MKTKSSTEAKTPAEAAHSKPTIKEVFYPELVCYIDDEEFPNLYHVGYLQIGQEPKVSLLYELYSDDTYESFIYKGTYGEICAKYLDKKEKEAILTPHAIEEGLDEQIIAAIDDFIKNNEQDKAAAKQQQEFYKLKYDSMMRAAEGRKLADAKAQEDARTTSKQTQTLKDLSSKPSTTHAAAVAKKGSGAGLSLAWCL